MNAFSDRCFQGPRDSVDVAPRDERRTPGKGPGVLLDDAFEPGVVLLQEHPVLAAVESALLQGRSGQVFRVSQRILQYVVLVVKLG